MRPCLCAAARLGVAAEQQARQLVEQYVDGSVSLDQLVLGMADIAGRDAVVRSLDLSEYGGQVRVGRSLQRWLKRWDVEGGWCIQCGGGLLAGRRMGQAG